MDSTQERVFQNDIIAQMQANGWQLGKPEHYDRATALYIADVLAFVKGTQPKEWQKFCKVYPQDSDTHFIKHLEEQLKKANPNAIDKELRSYGTLGVLRHGLKIRNARFSLCQFMPEHNLNPQTLARYQENVCRIVPELVYSPYATLPHHSCSHQRHSCSHQRHSCSHQRHSREGGNPAQEVDPRLRGGDDMETGKKAKAWRIDLVLFINGLPVATLELKSEFKQSVDRAITQYKTTRLPKDPQTGKPEPLLTFKRGALVHFAVSQYEVFMATRLDGANTFFLPFNKGTREGGAGNDIPEDENQYATDYLWNEVLLPDNLLNILHRFIHLEIDEKEHADGRKYKKETLIFPRYHQWDVVRKLIGAAKNEGTGHKYLIQHSAGSGKSNSIAWTAHQLSTLYNERGEKQFDSVIVITDRTVLDSQLQDTIYQFEHADGVVGRINNKEGEGSSKSEKLAKALATAQPIIIVTIQTFPFVLDAIADSVSLQQRCYAVIADEAHSSQTGDTAKRLKQVLMVDGEAKDLELSAEDKLNASVAARRHNSNLSYFAFTATPKAKTLETFGRLPKPEAPPSIKNIPVAFHVYSMRQAIEEGFILDVLKNYTNYKVAYKLAQQLAAADEEVDSKKAKVKLNRWVRLHDYNISQKVRVIVDHYRTHVMGLLHGQAKAMVVTSSRKEAVRYKLAFDKYLAEDSSCKEMGSIQVMVAFSGEVEFSEDDPDSAALLDQKFTEKNMNPGLKGREMRKAFDTMDYQIMLVANKFQTGFDQPKLCAMYVDKPLGGVECVQTLSRLNRTYPGKKEGGTFVLDFVNEPEEILASFQPYYQTAQLSDVSDPDKLFVLFNKLRESGIFTWNEVEKFCAAFLSNNKSNAAISNICKPAVERWQKRYSSAVDAYQETRKIFERTKAATNDAVLLANAENSLKECKREKDRLEIFKKDLGSFTRFYEFMSQIVEYDDLELEKLSLFARFLRPLLRERRVDEDDIDLTNVEMSHYRLSKIREQHLQLREDSADDKLEPGNDIGSAKAKDKKEAFMSQILERLNDLFVTDNLTDKDMINYACTVRDKLAENAVVMKQIANNTAEQALLGDFPQAIDDAVMESSEAHQEMMVQYLSNPELARGFARVVFDLLKQ